VNGNGAYEGEMDEVALFESALRAAVPARPDPLLGARLVPRLAGTARAATLEAEQRATRRARRSRRGLVARVGIAVAAIPLIFAGLAVAGVTVPAPARDAFDAVGVTLPNQPSDHQAAQNATTPATTTTGNDVSDAAKNPAHRGKGGNSAAAHRHALAQRAKARGKAKGHTLGQAIGLNDATPPGQTLAPTPPAHSNAGGSSGSHSNSHAALRPRPFPPSHARGGGNGR
jgi:hypothetical protein